MIHQFRAVWHEQTAQPGGAERGLGAEAAPSFGRGGAAQVAHWALRRAAAILQVAGRTRLRIGENPQDPLTPHERSIALVASFLAKGDRERAREQARWLVRPAMLEPLLRALEPVASGPARLPLLAV